MSNRAPPSGINRDIQRKKDAKYPAEYEAQARQWLESILGKGLSDQAGGQHSFAQSLRTGVELCTVMNKLLEHSGQQTIKKVNTSSMAFKQMENIGNFLQKAEAYGVPNGSLFQTIDLYEERDVGSVVMCLYTLGGAATKKNYPVKWGIAVSDPNKRDFSEETLAAGRAVISQQAGFTKGATQAGSGGFGNTRRL